MKVYAAGKITGLPRSAVLEKFEKAKTLWNRKAMKSLSHASFPTTPTSRAKTTCTSASQSSTFATRFFSWTTGTTAPERLPS